MLRDGLACTTRPKRACIGTGGVIITSSSFEFRQIPFEFSILRLELLELPICGPGLGAFLALFLAMFPDLIMIGFDIVAEPPARALCATP